MWQVEYTKKFLKELAALPVEIQSRVEPIVFREHPNFAKRHRTSTRTLYKPLSLASLASLAVRYFILGISPNTL
jgi:mRNA-degrading endonuclease RelE of RelBE toxin-antitoxin system